jgi:BASS family bile acid:Na+ symporter
MLAGAGLALALRLDRRDAVAIASECGLQNAGLGIFVATTVLATPVLAVPSVVYALIMNLGAFALIYAGRRLIPAPAAS